MVPVLVLAVIAVVLIKTLMSVVARDETAAPASSNPDNLSTAAGDLTVELHATVNDDVRAFLLPAVAEPAPFEQAAVEKPAVDLTSATDTDANASS